MAKDKNEFGDDDLGNWDDMGFGDDDFADFDAPPPKDDRKPVVKVATSFLKGAAEELTDPTRVRKMALDALPEGYGKATNLADTIASTGRELYHTTAEELKPVIKDAKRVARRVLPLTKSLLPANLQKKLEDMTTDNDYKGPSVDQTRDAQINSEVADIFKLQMENDARDKAEDEVNDATKRKQDTARFKTELQTLNAILGGINRQVAYQDQIASKYQKKHLELQFLQYFTLRDTYELHKASSKETKQQLDLVVKNTGLPEYQKTNLTEHAGHLFRERLLNAASSKVNQFAKGYIDKYKDNIIKAGKENIGAFKDAAMNGIMSGDALLDAQESMADAGIQGDKYKTAGGFLGGQAGGWLGSKVSKFAKPFLEKNPGIAKWGNKLEYGVDNFASLASDWAKGDQGENTQFDWFNKALRGFKNLSPTEVVDSSLGDSDLTKSQDAVPFNHLARKTLTDIIPGYLSRIHHELAIIRTGDPSLKRLGYDLKDGGFASMDKVTKSMGSVLFNQTENFDKVKDTTNSLIDGLEKQHGKKFSDTQRKALYDKFIGEAASGQGRFDVKKFSDVDQWKDLSDEDALQLSYMFSDDVGEEQQNKYSKEFLKIRGGVNNPTDAIKALIDSGQLESMRALGLVTGEGADRKVSQERIVDILRNGGFGEPTADGNPPNGAPPNGLNNRPGGGGPLGDLRNASDAPKGAGQNPGGLDTPKNPNEFMETIGEYQMLLLEDIRKGIANPQALAQYADAARSDPKASEEECTCVDKMIDAYKAGNDELAQHLANVYELLASGQLQTMSMNMPFDPEKAKGMLGRGLGKVKNAGKWGIGKVTGFYSSMMDMQKNILKGGVKGVWAGIKGAGELAFGKTKDKLNEWGDVYVKGTGRPILTWAQLKAGEYLNEDGTPITSWKDVKGPVKNKAGEYVLSAEQFAKGLVDEHARPMFTKIKDFGVKWGTRLSNFVTSPFRGMKDAIKGTYNTIKGFVERPRDMYLPGNPVPVLLATVMNAGGYKNSDGTVIKKMTDIKGTVYDLEGNVVISLESLKAGLVDIAGKKFKSLGGAMWDGAKKLVGGAVDLGVKAFKGVSNTLSKTIGGLKSGAGNLLNKGKGLFKGMRMPGMGGSSEMMEVIGEYQILLLEEIRDAIRDQSPKTVKGDFDGDGVRNGSGASLSVGRKKNREEREAKQKAKEEERNKNKPEKKGGLMGLLTMIGGAVMGMAKGLMDLPKTLITAMRAMSAAKALGGVADLAGNAGRGGMLARVGRGLGTVARGLGGAVGTVGRLAFGGVAGIARGAWAVGSLAVGVLGAPVVLGIAAAAAVGYLGYKAWKSYKKSKNSDLLKYRVAQYGLDYDNDDQTGKVFELESLIGPHIKFNSTAPTIDWKSVDIKRVREVFGIKDEDPEGIQRFGKWFETRFGPIFVSHMKMLNKYSKSTKIEEADEAVKIEDKLKFLEGVQVDDAEATYGELTSPFDEDSLPMGPSAVKKVYDEVVAHIKEQMPESKDNPKGETSLLSKAANLAMMASPMGLMAKGLKKLADMTGMSDTLAKAGSWLADKGSTIAKFIPGLGLGMMAVNWLKDKLIGKEFKVPSILNREIDPLTSIRYRLYGVFSMEYARVSPISKLEELVIKDIDYSGSGKAEYDGDVDDVWEEVGGTFTSKPDDDAVKDRWTKWFSERFLPVLISYLTAVQKFIANGNPFEAYDRVKAPQSLEIARFMNGATSTEDKQGQANASVWLVSASPFDDYEINTDSSIVKPFMMVLEEDANKEVLNEKVKTAQAAKVQGLVNKVTGGAGNNSPPSPLRVDRGNAERSGGSSALLKAMYGTMPMAGGDAGYMSGGLEVIHPGSGSGGSVNDLPESKGPDGEYSTYRDMIIAASKMVGVDPGLMATMAAIESGFRGRVKADTSSATGLYQFIGDTWKAMLAKYGPKYGLDPSTPPTDPRANALLGAEYIRENSEILSKGLGRQPTDTDIYLAHFLGPTGALKLLRAQGDSNAATLMPKAANANKSIFFADGRPRTVSQVYAEIDRRVGVHRSKYAGDARSGAGMSAEVKTVTSTPATVGIMALPASGGSAPAGDPSAATGGANNQGTSVAGGGVGGGEPSLGGGGGSVSVPQGPNIPGVTSGAGAPPTNPDPNAAKSAGNAILQREKSSDGGTFGKLTLPDGTSYNTLELPWRNNESGKSCIPPGTYKVETRNSPKFGPGTYEVKGVPGRTAILIHSGNYAGNVDKGQKSNVEGCILLGLSRNTQSGQPMIQESKAAMKAFTEKMGGRPFTLTVISAEGDAVAPGSEGSSTTSLSPMAQSVAASAPASMPTPVAPVTNSVPASSGGGGGEPSLGGNVAEAAVIRKAQAERQAQATTMQDQEANAQLNQNFSGVAEVMKKQLETQLKMAQSLDNIDKGIQTLVGGGSQAPGQEASKPEPSTTRTNTAAKPTDVPVRMTPISMKRIQAQ